MTLSGSLASFGLFLVKLGNGLFQFIKAKHCGIGHEKAQDHSAHHRVPDDGHALDFSMILYALQRSEAP